MRDVFKNSKPDLIFNHGDTTTSTAASLAVFYQQIPVAHVEAGLRTGNIYSPWPEEMNRQITGRIATINFSPTQLSRKNLLKKNIADNKIVVTGNTVIDALHWVTSRINNDQELKNNLTIELKKKGYDTSILIGGKRMILITGHRRDNFGEGFLHICHAIQDLASNNPTVDFVYPMHLNPYVRKPIHQVFGDTLSEKSNIFFIEPLEYFTFVFLMEKAHIVLTDSGGIQEEVPGLGKPVLVMRNTTERPEAVEAGTVKLVGTEYKTIVDNVTMLLTDESEYEKMSKANNPYGDGKACQRIIDFLKGM